MMKKIYVIYGAVFGINLIALGALFFEVGLVCELFFGSAILAVLFCFTGGAAAFFGVIFGLIAGRTRWGLALLSAALLTAYVLVPNLWEWRRVTEFALRRPGYMEVVEMAQAGQITPSSAFIEIDPAHRWLLSCDLQFGVEHNERG